MSAIRNEQSDFASHCQRYRRRLILDYKRRPARQVRMGLGQFLNIQITREKAVPHELTSLGVAFLCSFSLRQLRTAAAVSTLNDGFGDV
jgi:hypothetical protein